MATSAKPIKNRAYTFTFGLVDSALTTALKSAPTLAAANIQVGNFNGTTFGTFANATNTPVVSGKACAITLTAAEMNYDNVCLVISGTGYCDQLVDIATRDTAIANFIFFMRDTSGNPRTGLGSAVTIVRSVDGGAFAGLTGSPAVAEMANGFYKVAIAAADTNCLDGVALYATASGSMPQAITLTSVY